MSLVMVHGKKRHLNWRPSLPRHEHQDLWRVSTLPYGASKAPLDIGNIPIWDQGQLGSCTAHGTGFLWSYRLWREKGHFIMPSRLFIYYCERMLEGDISKDAGAVISDGLKSLTEFGCPVENIWAYNPPKFATKPPKRVWTAALKDVALAKSAVPMDVNTIKQSLASDLPVTFGFTVFKSFETSAWTKLSHPIMPMPAKGESILGGHCVAFVGYDDALGCFWCRNSWGHLWANRGRFLMPYDFLKFCSDGWNLSKVA